MRRICEITTRASETCRDHENTKVHEEHEKDLSFFFVIFADSCFRGCIVHPAS
jgi:hypothetical protein